MLVDSIITMVLDASLSMNPIKKSTIEGFNSFVDEQRKLRDICWLNLVMFGSYVMIPLEKTDIHQANLLTEDNYPPMGSTALYDAIGEAINLTEKQGYEPDAEMAQVYVVIQTDGIENTSTKYGRETIRRMIREKTNSEGWQFIFLGTNQDAEAVARDLGIREQQALTYAGKNGTKQAFLDVARSVREARENDAPAQITDEAKRTQRLLLECRD